MGSLNRGVHFICSFLIKEAVWCKFWKPDPKLRTPYYGRSIFRDLLQRDLVIRNSQPNLYTHCSWLAVVLDNRTKSIQMKIEQQQVLGCLFNLEIWRTIMLILLIVTNSNSMSTSNPIIYFHCSALNAGPCLVLLTNLTQLGWFPDKMSSPTNFQVNLLSHRTHWQWKGRTQFCKK